MEVLGALQGKEGARTKEKGFKVSRDCKQGT